MIKQTLFAAVSLAMLSGPIAGHAQMQPMNAADMRDVSGQGSGFQPLTEVSFYRSLGVLGVTMFKLNYQGGIGIPDVLTLTVWTPPKLNHGLIP